MKRALCFALFALLSLSLAQTRTLNLLIWSEYIDPEIVRAFEEEYGARINIDTYESNEDALAKLEAGGLGLFDVVVPSNYIVPVFIELGLLQPLDQGIVTNLDNLMDDFLDPPYDPGNVYTAAYQWGTTGIAYRSDRVETPDSWAVLFDPEVTDEPFALLDDMRPMIGVALLYLGYDYNSEDPDELAEARDLLVDAKHRSLGFYGGPGGRNLLIQGEASYAVVYSGDALGAFADDERIAYAIPREGAEVWVDVMAVLANAPDAELANEFVNFMLRPDIGAQLTNYVYFASPNEAALPYIDEELAGDPIVFPDEETMGRLVFT
jgi:spermidine/putrescine transport system substrate-binding protein